MSVEVNIGTSKSIGSLNKLKKATEGVGKTFKNVGDIYQKTASSSQRAAKATQNHTQATEKGEKALRNFETGLKGNLTEANRLIRSVHNLESQMKSYQSILDKDVKKSNMNKDAKSKLNSELSQMQTRMTTINRIAAAQRTRLDRLNKSLEGKRKALMGARVESQKYKEDLDKAQAAIGALTYRNDALERSLKKSQDRWKKQNTSIKGVASQIRNLLTLYIAFRTAQRVAQSVISPGIEFERQMAIVGGITRTKTVGQDGQGKAIIETLDNFNKLQAKAMQLGEETEWTAMQAAESMQYLAMAGFSANQILATVEGTLDIATAGFLDLGEAANISTNALTAMGLLTYDTIQLTKNLNRVNSALVMTSTKANVSVRQIAESFKYVAPKAHQMGESIEGLVSWIGLLGNVGIQGCYDPETEVLTQDGWKRWEDVTEDDVFATVNPDTHALEYHKATKLIAYRHTGKMWSLVNRSIDLLVTPNHNMYVQKRGSELFEMLSAEDSFGKSIGFMASFETNNFKDVSTYTIDGFTQNRGNWNKEVEPKTFAMDDFLELLGFYLSEGSCDKDNRGNYRIRITQVKPHIKAKIESCLDRCGMKYHLSKPNNYTIVNQQLYLYFSQFGKQPHRFIPTEFKNLSSRQLSILYTALMEGDGCNNTYYSTSKKLADDVQEICLKMGLKARVKRVQKDSTTKNGDATLPIYLVHSSSLNRPKFDPSEYRGVHGARLDLSIAETSNKWVDYDGMVYCAEVPPNHVLMVRRNGKAVACGNSMAGTQLAFAYGQMDRAFQSLGSSSTGKDFRDMLHEINLAGWDAVKIGGVFTERAGRAVNSLRYMIPFYDALKESLEGSTTAHKDLADVMRNTTWGRIKELQSVFQGIFIRSFVDGPGGKFGDMIQNWTEYLRDNSDVLVHWSNAIIDVASNMGNMLNFLGGSPMAGIGKWLLGVPEILAQIEGVKKEFQPQKNYLSSGRSPGASMALSQTAKADTWTEKLGSVSTFDIEKGMRDLELNWIQQRLLIVELEKFLKSDQELGELSSNMLKILFSINQKQIAEVESSLGKGSVRDREFSAQKFVGLKKREIELRDLLTEKVETDAQEAITKARADFFTQYAANAETEYGAFISKLQSQTNLISTEIDQLRQNITEGKSWIPGTRQTSLETELQRMNEGIAREIKNLQAQRGVFEKAYLGSIKQEKSASEKMDKFHEGKGWRSVETKDGESVRGLLGELYSLEGEDRLTRAHTIIQKIKDTLATSEKLVAGTVEEEKERLNILNHFLKALSERVTYQVSDVTNLEGVKSAIGLYEEWKKIQEDNIETQIQLRDLEMQRKLHTQNQRLAKNQQAHPVLAEVEAETKLLKFYMEEFGNIKKMGQKDSPYHEFYNKMVASWKDYIQQRKDDVEVYNKEQKENAINSLRDQLKEQDRLIKDHHRSQLKPWDVQKGLSMDVARIQEEAKAQAEAVYKEFNKTKERLEKEGIWTKVEAEMGKELQALLNAIKEGAELKIKVTTEDAKEASKWTNQVQARLADPIAGGKDMMSSGLWQMAGGAEAFGEATSFMDHLTSGMEMAAGAATGIAGSMLAGVGYVQAAIQGAQALIDLPTQLMSSIVNLLQSAADLPDVFTELVDQIPELIPKAFEGIARFFSEAMPSLIQQIPEMISLIVDGFIDAIPSIIESAISLMPTVAIALAQAVAEAIGNLPNIVGGIASGLVSGITGGIKKIFSFGSSSKYMVSGPLIDNAQSTQMFAQLHNMTDQVTDTFLKMAEDLEAEQLHTALNNFKNAVQGVSNELIGFTVGTLYQDSVKLNQEFRDTVLSLAQVGADLSEAIELYHFQAAQLIESHQQPVWDIVNQILTRQQDREREDWTADEFSSEFRRLEDLFFSLDKASAHYFEDSINIFKDQISILEEIERLNEESVKELTANIKTYDQIIETLDKFIWELQGGSLAPVQSKDLMESEYARLRDAVFSLDPDEDPAQLQKAVDEFQKFANEYLDFYTAYGYDYKTYNEKVLRDAIEMRELTKDLKSEAELQLQATEDGAEAITAAIETMEKGIVDKLLGKGGFQDLIEQMKNGNVYLGNSFAYTQRDVMKNVLSDDGLLVKMAESIQKEDPDEVSQRTWEINRLKELDAQLAGMKVNMKDLGNFATPYRMEGQAAYYTGNQYAIGDYTKDDLNAQFKNLNATIANFQYKAETLYKARHAGYSAEELKHIEEMLDRELRRRAGTEGQAVDAQKWEQSQLQSLQYLLNRPADFGGGAGISVPAQMEKIFKDIGIKEALIAQEQQNHYWTGHLQETANNIAELQRTLWQAQQYGMTQAEITKLHMMLDRELVRRAGHDSILQYPEYHRVGGMVGASSYNRKTGSAKLTNGIGIAGEAGPEWIVPTYEPERSNFLADVGASPSIIASAVANAISPLVQAASNGSNSGSGDTQVHVYIDGREVSNAVVSRVVSGDRNMKRALAQDRRSSMVRAF